jgi:hypothetical protein
VVARGDYETLTPATIDQVWLRLRAGRLRLEEREEISRGLAAGRSYREIATALDRARR